MRRAAALLGASALLLSSCAGPLGPGVTGRVRLAAPGREVFRMTYLGAGGWILEAAGERVLTAPLFSNPSFLRTGLGTIEADTVLIDGYAGRYDLSDVPLILVGHAHYDHLMDVPRIATRHAPRARILGSATVERTLGTWAGVDGRVDVIEAADGGDVEGAGRWLRYGERIRVMPLRSMHGPHFAGITLYRGGRDRPLDRPPRRADEWIEGETWAFLIDFLDADGGVAVRIYYQDATAAPPLGFAPEAVIAERAVDVAVLVPATFEELDWDPEALVRNLRPGRIVLGHWEDFFVPVDEEAVAVPFTDVREFERRLDRVFSGPVWRPDRFTELEFPACADCPPGAR